MTVEEMNQFFGGVNISKHGQDSETYDLYFHLTLTDFSEDRDDKVCSLINVIRLDSSGRAILNAMERYIRSMNRKIDMHKVSFKAKGDFVQRIRDQRSHIAKKFPGVRKLRKEVARSKREAEMINELRKVVHKSMNMLSSDDVFRIVNDCFVETVMDQ